MRGGAVDTWMNFAGAIEGRARVDVPDWSRTNIALDRRDIAIHDARPLVGRLSLDREGFVLLRDETPVPEDDRADGAKAYAASVAAHLKEMSGAALVLPQSNGLLRRRSEKAGVKGSIGPSRWVHMDYTRSFAPKWLDWLSEWHQRELRGYQRFAIFQTWRCISPPPQDNTLAFCDASTIDAGDCIPFDACIAAPYDKPGNQFESQLSRFNSGQRWYCFPDLEPDELIVFKGHDSDPARDAQPLHNSIDFPDAPSDAEPRASLEARFFAFFDA
jgi:hypothetical protein